MLTRHAFTRAWLPICKRFGHTPDDGAEDFYAYLCHHFESDAAFLEAARAVWATNRFFPRPADFLGVRVSREWRTVLALATGGAWGEAEKEAWASLSPVAKLATEAVNGLDGIRNGRDPVRLRSAWSEAYEQELVVQSGRSGDVFALEPGTGPQLAAGGDR